MWRMRGGSPGEVRRVEEEQEEVVGRMRMERVDSIAELAAGGGGGVELISTCMLTVSIELGYMVYLRHCEGRDGMVHTQHYDSIPASYQLHTQKGREKRNIFI